MTILSKQLELSIELVEGRKKLQEQKTIIARQAHEILTLNAQIEFLELKILRITTPPVRRVG